MKKFLSTSVVTSFFVILNLAYLSCETKQKDQSAPDSYSGTSESVDEPPTTENYASLVEGDWKLDNFRLKDGYGDTTQNRLMGELSSFFTTGENASGMSLNGGLFTSVRVDGEYEVTGDIINVSATQRGGFGMLGLNQKFKIIKVSGSELILETLGGHNAGYTAKDAMDKCLASGGPFGFDHLLITLKK